MTSYEGKRIKIAKVSQVEVIDYYPDGENFNKDSTEKVMKLEIETESLKELDANGNNLVTDLEITNKEGI
jgi:hypothetical protein